MGKSKKGKRVEDVYSGEGIEIVTREEWGALPLTKEVDLMKIPALYIRFSYSNTKEKSCSSYETCCKELQDLQKKFLTEESCDLPYNFLIGSDGRAYEGRGWYVNVERHLSLRKFKRKCIDISYIGEYERTLPPDHMTYVAATLVSLGIKLKLIKKLPQVESLNDYRDFLYYEDQKR